MKFISHRNFLINLDYVSCFCLKGKVISAWEGGDPEGGFWKFDFKDDETSERAYRELEKFISCGIGLNVLKLTPENGYPYEDGDLNV